MKESMKPLVEASLLLPIAALAYVLIAPERPRDISLAQPASPQADEPAAPQQPASPERTLATFGQVAALFGWTPPAAAAPAAPRTASAPAVAEAVWLKPIGFVIDEKGDPTYIFKDTRAGSVIPLTLRKENKGWTLLEVREKEFLLAFEAKRYTVKRGK